MTAIDKLEDAVAILTLVSMTDELGHELKDEAARAATVSRRLVEEAIDELQEVESKAAPKRKTA